MPAARGPVHGGAEGHTGPLGDPQLSGREEPHRLHRFADKTHCVPRERRAQGDKLRVTRELARGRDGRAATSWSRRHR